MPILILIVEIAVCFAVENSYFGNGNAKVAVGKGDIDLIGQEELLI